MITPAETAQLDQAHAVARQKLAEIIDNLRAEGIDDPAKAVARLTATLFIGLVTQPEFLTNLPAIAATAIVELAKEPDR